jgi:hypothetical protein
MIDRFVVSGILETWKFPSDVELLNVERALNVETIGTERSDETAGTVGTRSSAKERSGGTAGTIGTPIPMIERSIAVERFERLEPPGHSFTLRFLAPFAAA